MSIPQNVLNLLNDQAATKVLTSVGKDGMPHSIVVGSGMSPNGEVVCCGEVLMKKSSANLAENKNVAVLVVKDMESYLIEAEVIEKQTEGEMFEGVKAELAKVGLPMSGLWIFKPTAIFNQSANPESGSQIC
ncbi:pyridoxamine 5'-phosphate oxidase family protein [Eubacteriaceae bacterium ES2]|nr:pyridoxamine 5'-phosphate oxidase family protein [Eubacteriaceae bacterium ES2]